MRPAATATRLTGSGRGDGRWNRSGGFGARSVSRGSSVDPDVLVREREVVAGLEPAAADRFAVHRGAVERLEVLDDPGAVAEQEPRVAARHLPALQAHIAAVGATDEELVLRAAAPVEREQHRWAWRGMDPLVDPRADHAERPRRRARAPRAPAEVADDVLGVDQPAAEQDVEPV